MSDYYSGYGGSDSSQDIVNSIDEFTDTIGNIGSVWAGYRGARANRQLQWDMMQYQLDWNSPANQVARLRAAGLSPYYGHAISPGNLDSLPDIGQDPMQAVSEGLSRSAAAAVQRITSRTAVMEAKLQALKVQQEYRRLLMAEDLFPVQRQIASENARTAGLTNEFLSSSMQDRLQDLINQRKFHGYEAAEKRSWSSWLALNWRDYYDELFQSAKTRNSYYKWMIEHGNDLFEFQKGQANIMNKHWDIINNPFGLDVGSGSINGFLNTLFSFLRLFAQ